MEVQLRERVDGRAMGRPGERVRGEIAAGPLLAGRSTKRLARELRGGEVALVDHRDIDRISAHELIEAGAVAVLNCSASTSGRYPNVGPRLLVDAGVVLVDLAGDALFDAVGDGDRVAVRAGAGAGVAEVLRGGEVLARGALVDRARVRATAEARGRELDEALERFARNTLEHMRAEHELLAEHAHIPRIAADMRGRAALVVARAASVREDLGALRPFIARERPVVVAVDGAADGLLAAGVTPALIVGDMDSAGERALGCGAQLLVQSYTDGRTPGAARLRELGLAFAELRLPGTSEDAALVVAAEQGASMIVSLGTPFSLLDFLERGRGGMASTFLTRLRVGEILIDARGVSRLGL